MAPRRKPKAATAPPTGREFKLRLPQDISDWVEQKAAAEHRPQNRIIINALATVPELEQHRNLALLVADITVTLARYSAHIVTHDLSIELLDAVDAVLSAEGGKLPGAVERLRVVRTAMQATETSRATGRE